MPDSLDALDAQDAPAAGEEEQEPVREAPAAGQEEEAEQALAEELEMPPTAPAAGEEEDQLAAAVAAQAEAEAQAEDQAGHPLDAPAAAGEPTACRCRRPPPNERCRTLLPSPPTTFHHKNRCHRLLPCPAPAVPADHDMQDPAGEQEMVEAPAAADAAQEDQDLVVVPDSGRWVGSITGAAGSGRPPVVLVVLWSNTLSTRAPMSLSSRRRRRGGGCRRRRHRRLPAPHRRPAPPPHHRGHRRRHRRCR